MKDALPGVVATLQGASLKQVEKHQVIEAETGMAFWSRNWHGGAWKRTWQPRHICWSMPLPSDMGTASRSYQSS